MLDYKIFAVNDVVIDISSPGFQQVPACGHYLTEVITWTIPSDAPIVQETDNNTNFYKLRVSSTDPDDDATYSLALDISGFYPIPEETYVATLNFDFVVTNPCLTTEYIAFTIDAVSQEAGQTSYTTFTEPEHTEGQEVND